MAKIILHLPQDGATDGAAEALAGRHLRLYRVIRDMARVEGIGLELRPRARDLTPASRTAPDDRFADGNLHILDDRSVQADNVLNCAVAYFWEFWHLDPKGTKAFSGIGDLAYDAADMPYARAQHFFAGQKARLVDKRRSKYGQKAAHTPLPEGALAVFLQGDFPRRQGATRFDDLAMLDVVRAHAGDRAILVKPHPLVTDPFTLAEIGALRDDRLTVTDANVHDILASCAVTVSINSTVALEGYLHRKPAILFGRSDFHHIAGRVQVPADFPDAMTVALARKRGYAQYLAWYFLRHCLRLGSPGLEPAIWARFAAAGFPKARLLAD